MHNKTRSTDIQQLSHAVNINSTKLQQVSHQTTWFRRKVGKPLSIGFQALHSKTLFDMSIHESMQPNLSC